MGFSLGKEGIHRGYQITLKLEDYMISTHKFGNDALNYCYFPIFTHTADA